MAAGVDELQLPGLPVGPWASQPTPSPPTPQVLGRIKQILEGQAHAGMPQVECTVDGCCGMAAKHAGSEGKEGQGVAVRVSAGGAAAAEEGAAAGASTADLSSAHTKPFRIVLAGHSLGELRAWAEEAGRCRQGPAASQPQGPGCSAGVTPAVSFPPRLPCRRRDVAPVRPGPGQGAARVGLQRGALGAAAGARGQGSRPARCFAEQLHLRGELC